MSFGQNSLMLRQHYPGGIFDSDMVSSLQLNVRCPLRTDKKRDARTHKAKSTIFHPENEVNC